MNNILEEYFLSEASSYVIDDQRVIRLQLKKELGEGHCELIPILPGFYISFNHLYVRRPLKNNEHQKFGGRVIKIDYCEQGGFWAEGDNGSRFSTSPNHAVYYGGRQYFLQAEFSEGLFRSIDIFCYVDTITASFKKTLGVEADRVEGFYRLLQHHAPCLTIPTPAHAMALTEILKNLFLCGNMELLRIRAMELFFLEMEFIGKECPNTHQPSVRSVERIKKVKQYIDKAVEQELSIDLLCDSFFMSRTTLKEAFRKTFHVPVYTYIKNCRMEHASRQLKEGDETVLEIANRLGYSNPSKFASAFKSVYGITPLQFRKKAQKEEH
ncbi:helix-turn-helix transcriptional regulator [Sediminispirochaeta bajacaliforniensis]|uniref:helix-turn-helix transcriptional regulator n=1 Tax=Sediminispirochaeta bajacaliforniensis TaxID=148 RepID=UPI0003784132|nr:AraC family transcriptional regulator [Sediminispirochaeta bajacaliforniensis]